MVTTDQAAGRQCIREQAQLLCFAHGHGALENPIPQAGVAVVLAVPVVHCVEHGHGVVDREYRPLGQNLEFTVGDDTGGFQYRIAVGIQPGHFQVDPHQPVVVRRLHREARVQ